MLLQTSIKPRLDGTVLVQGDDKKTYRFENAANGAFPECEITHEPTIKRLMSLKTFFPADSEQADLAMAKLRLDEAQEQSDSFDGDDESVEVSALPIEANTKPAALPGKNARSRR